MNHIGNKVKQYRESKGITQIELAKALGYKDHSSIGKIESGVNDIPLSMLQSIAQILGVRASELFDDECEVLTAHEQEVLAAYRSLSEDVKRHIDFVLGIEKKTNGGSIRKIN